MTKFSAVITNFNKAEYLSAAIESVLNQSYPAHELIVVDDASTDGSISIIEKYLPKIKLIKNTTNKGVSAARNAGWDASSGEYIAFLDGDDLWMSNKLQYYIDHLEDVKNGILLADPFIINEHSGWDTVSKKGFKKITRLQLLISNPIPGTSIVVPKDFVLKFDEKMSYSEDHDLALRLSMLGPIYLAAQPLTIIRRPVMSSGGLSQSKWNMRRGELRMYRKFCWQNKRFLIFLPFLHVFSILKYGYLCLKQKI